MLRLKVLASVVPLAIAAFFAGGKLTSGSHPCIAAANTSVEIADLPWHADLHVAFTDDPAAATVRVQITEDAQTADFAIVDDNDTAETSACEATTVLSRPAQLFTVSGLLKESKNGSLIERRTTR